MTQGRKCGRCTTCCTYLRVEELHKPEGAPCWLATKDGCTAYGKRPDSCRKFECLWLMGVGKESHRPDRSKLLVYTDQSPKIGEVVVVREIASNGLRGSKAQGLLKELKRAKVDLYIHRNNGTLSIQGSADFIKKAEAIKEEMEAEKAARVELKVLS